MIHIIRDRATPGQIEEMLQPLGVYIKLAVDIRREVLAGGGVLHADCESALLDDGSRQEDIWGADWNPRTQELTYEALINIRPQHGNRSMVIQDPALRAKIKHIVRELLGGVEGE
jgi:hypothetical protein